MNVIKQIQALKSNINIRHGILYTFFAFINNGVGFLLLLILAKFLEPKGYGALNLFTSVISLLNIIISLSTTGYISVSFFKRPSEVIRQIIAVCIITTSVVLIILSIILLLCPAFIEEVSGLEVKYLWIGIFISYFQVFNTINLDIWRLEEKPTKYGVYSLSFSIISFVLSFIFVVNLHFGWEGRIYAWLLIGGIYSIISIVFLIGRGYLRLILPDKNIFKQTFIYSLPLLPHLASYWLKQGFDKFIINYYYNEQIVGYYSFAMNLAAIITMIGTAFNSTNSVFIFKTLSKNSDNNRSRLNRQNRIMTIVFIIVALLTIFGSGTFIYFIMPDYIESVIYIGPLCIGALFQCVYLIWVNYIFYYQKTKKLMLISMSSALLQFLLSIMFTRYAVMYTAIISMIGSAVTMLMVFFYSKKLLAISKV